MDIFSQLYILKRLSALNGNPKISDVASDYDNIQEAIHHEIDEFERKEELAKELHAVRQGLREKRTHRNGSRAQRLADEKRGRS